MNLDRNGLAIAACALTACAAFFVAQVVGPAWDRVTKRVIADLSPRMQELRLDNSQLPWYLRWWGLSMLAVFVGFTFGLGMLPVAIAAVYLIYVSPRLLLSSMIRRRSYLLRDQMVAACTGLANASRAGLTLAEGMADLAEESPEPLSSELRRIVSDFHGGRPLAEAIDHAKQRLKLDSFTLFAAAILVALDRGGRLTEALERIGRSLQENQRLERRLESETESGRRVVVILAATPFAFLAVFAGLEPEGISLLFSTIIGQLVFCIVVTIVYVSVRYCNKILTIEV